MNGIIGNGLFQRLALAALALAAALACAILWNAATAPAASAQSSTAASLDSCSAAPDSGRRIVEGRPFTLSASVRVRAEVLSLWEVHFAVNNEEYETNSENIPKGDSRTFKRQIGAAPDAGTYTLECVLHSGVLAGGGLGLGFADRFIPRLNELDREHGRREFTFTVHPASAQAAPADDHGDTRSSSTEISVGSDANGVIGTASDVDYFSFRAERGMEYTIETHIPDSSGVDTFITLYRAGGSRLGYDNNGGDGRASELALIAPSTDAYYVRVRGSGGSTGGYRLSVSHAFQVLPSPEIIMPQAPAWAEDVEVGRSFDFELTLVNASVGDGENGGLAVSFPTLAGGSKSSNGWTSSLADVQVVSRAGWDDVSIYKSGDSISYANGSTMRARHLLIESDDSTWGANTRRALTLRVTPKRAGSFPIMFRGQICADRDSDCSRSPESGSSDQQGYKAFGETVNVVAPPPPGKLQIAPIGGLTVYVNIGATRTWSFGAWSADYTLTNSVPNGETIRWEASVDEDKNWITVAPGAGELRGGQSATVSVSVNETGANRAEDLPIGTHTASVTFSNKTNNGDGDLTRTVTFHRLNTNADPADSEPVETLRMSPSRSEVYRSAGLEEAWRQMASMSERGLLNPVDIAVIDSNLWRPPAGSSGRDERIVLSEFDWDNIDSEHISGPAGIQSSRHGYAVTSIIAAVNHAASDAPPNNSFSGVVTSVPGLEYHIDFYAAGLLNFSRVVDPTEAFRAINLVASSSPDVVNMSIGNPCSAFLGNDICTATHGGGVIDDAQDTIFVVAAGNDGEDAGGTWPASIDADNVITVAATDKLGNSRGFWDDNSSNYGPKIDIAAPSEIHALNFQPNYPAYNPFEGTSAAAPLVSGVVALLRAIDPNISAGDVKDLLRSTGNPITVCVADEDLPLAQCEGKTEEWIVMNAGAAVKKLMDERGIAHAPAYAPSAPTPAPTAASEGRIAFVSQRDGGPSEIYAMNADGSGLMRLTNDSAHDSEPSWSPDGERIAFQSNRDGNWEIYAMNADGSGLTRLTNSSVDDHSPSWSPDGRRIAFQSWRDGNWEIYAMNVDGSGLTRLATNSASDSPSWSPDGRRIAFSSWRDGNREIYAMNADGSDATRLTNNSAVDLAPSWSPDGQRIAFVSFRVSGDAEIYAMNADGSGLMRLTNNSVGDYSPSWSPDGRRIAFQSYRRGNFEIHAMNADGSGVARLTNNSATDADPSWGPSTARVGSAAPQNAADDHGDTRSSATRISAGSSANGVIGTASDKDYFRFQAQRGREYTIETSIASGSSLDTLVTLYRANGSVLGVDADSGAGLASKIVWTAPSSATYYVEVKGIDNTTGGYRLSVSSSAPPPVARLTAEGAGVPASAEVGRNFDFRLKLRNDGGDGARGGISVSFPTLAGGSKSSDGYSSQIADVQVVGYTSGTGNVSLYKSGDSLNHANGSTTRALHLLVESDDATWRASTERIITLRVTPKRAGELPIRIRGWICADGYSDCSRSPSSGSTSDQQGYKTYAAAVSVSAPADDHGDTRSSATRISAGSSANGVIGTASDNDYFRFQAQRGREYTIETSIASGSSLDTLVTLYRANGSVLGVDADGGAGLASKIVWTAPSSAAHYVEVKGINNSTGGYRLSVSSRAPTQPPVARLSSPDGTSSLEVGRTIEYVVALVNDGGDGEHGGVSVSFPTLTGGSKSSGGYSSSLADVQVVRASGTRNVSLYKSGDSINHANGSTMRARHLLIESDDATWSSSTQRLFVLSVTPKRAGELRVLVRGWICADGYSDCSRSPSSGSTSDQQGYRARVITINAVAPAPPPPAPTAARNGPIAFVSNRDGNNEIYAMNSDGSNQTRLTNNSARDSRPSWSPDGRRIAFDSNRSGNYGIYAMNADGSGVTRLTDNSADDWGPSWSPDGRRIAFASDRGGNYDIYAMNADGSGVTRLTNRPNNNDYRPRWSPDGGKIAFYSYYGDNNSEIVVMNANGSGVARLMNNPARAWGPSWSPDGRRIAFSSNRSGNREIYAMNADGSNVARLTNNSAFDHGPSWSPDGRRIAFSSDREIYAMDADGSNVTRLTNNSVVDLSPSWGPSTARVGSAAPQNAADDHGDSRSSATRISAGSGANGVIGTASDADYFSFQAQRGREYTIETSIPSSSDVDTFITLYRSNGSSLDDDDDGGDGYASKIVWTAPSSATYYVKVDGLGDSTGGYRLSLSSRASAQPPAARLDATEFTRSVEVGQPFEFYVELANVGGDGEHGGVSVSFPELTGGSKSSRGYSSSLADVRVVDYTSGTGNVSLYKSGDSLNHANGSRMNARHLLIESDDAAWRSSTERLLALVVTPKRAGELRVLVRGWICADGYSDCSRDPSSGSASDQQGYRAMVRTFNVVAAAPADDHGDSRSSATRISSGSSANGVIGTASDADYFSFQAQRGREYTIETSIPSDSDVDTFIELYAANGSLLDEDDDGGDGYASKIEWTAPSSATYYVKVDSLGYSTGGYRLSVSSSAPAAPPSARFSAASVPDSATAGRSFDVSVELRNDGGDGERGGISVSFPTLTGGSKSSREWSSSLADVRVVDYTSGTGNVSLYKSGDSLNHANGSRMSARHLLIESDDATWRASAERELTLRITPKRAGEFPIRIRGWICADGYSDCARAPSSDSTSDQQGYMTFVDTVNVVAAAPADDHGDSRSSATRISAGSSANGVIGTASDVDYFSFQAQRGREYTIETSIPSSSDVDTEITLYSSGGSRLGGNDDGGDGYASRLVWSAPSSATYYVKVDGLGDSTGGYRLSLSSRAPTPAPSPVITTRWTETAEVGQSFDFIIYLTNSGGGGERGGVSVSFPTLTGGSKSSNNYTSSAADVRVVSYTSGRGDVSIYKTGDSLNHANGSTIAARHLLIESDNSTWGASTRRSLTLRITPKRAGELPVKIRGWICADGYSDCARARPSSGSTTDQQGYRTYLDTVNVVAPTPAPAQPPVAEVRAISIPREATVGQSFEIRVELGNGGGAGDNGGFSISFPSLTGGSKSSGRYASSAADVQTVNASAWDDVSMYKSGDTISSLNGDIPAEHLLVEARDNSWSPSSDRALRLRVTPKRAGEFPIRIAAWICSDTACSLNPESGARDQQGWSATVGNVTVRPAAPADDHGDSRSSATRVSAGASENGVIGTASDADYFSFRASRSLEYTIQTGIRSGSDVDTFITLYDANGSFVDEDDDGGNGFASKIVWTAPSSATYYVRVDGLGDSTGGYWLSVTERAQAPAPVPNVSRISVPNAATAGRSFDVTVELRNDGGDGERGGISVSFPTLTGGSKSSRDWSSSLADVRVVDYTGGTGNVSLYKSGDSINHSNGSRMSARHLLIESDDSTWRSDTRRVLTLRVTPKRAGELPVKVRGWICADGYSDCSRAPTHGMDDQQGYDTAERAVLVVAPAPADDHGDDRSSATAMNANSRVGGRIETRGDEDYFSFRAQSGAEYTIETRAPSGLDTIITLYSAQGARLMQDDDDGAGRASKMEWTAPSSGTYYVKVYAHGGAVGAYELSLSETPPPVAGGPVSFRFNWSYSHSRIEVGESFEIEGRIHSVSGGGDRGGVSISFPSLTGGRSDVRRYRSSAADVNVVTSEGMSVFVYAEDEIIDTPGLPDVTARHLLFESDDIRWSSSTDRTLKLRVTPKRAGEIPILIRGWVCANRYLNCARYPSDGSNGSRDQQGQWAVSLNVTVVDPP